MCSLGLAAGRVLWGQPMDQGRLLLPLLLRRRVTEAMQVATAMAAAAAVEMSLEVILLRSHPRWVVDPAETALVGEMLVEVAQLPPLPLLRRRQQRLVWETKVAVAAEPGEEVATSPAPVLAVAMPLEKGHRSVQADTMDTAGSIVTVFPSVEESQCWDLVACPCLQIACI